MARSTWMIGMGRVEIHQGHVLDVLRAMPPAPPKIEWLESFIAATARERLAYAALTS